MLLSVVVLLLSMLLLLTVHIHVIDVVVVIVVVLWRYIYKWKIRKNPKPSLQWKNRNISSSKNKQRSPVLSDRVLLTKTASLNNWNGFAKNNAFFPCLIVVCGVIINIITIIIIFIIYGLLNKTNQHMALHSHHLLWFVMKNLWKLFIFK